MVAFEINDWMLFNIAKFFGSAEPVLEKDNLNDMFLRLTFFEVSLISASLEFF